MVEKIIFVISLNLFVGDGKSNYNNWLFKRKKCSELISGASSLTLNIPIFVAQLNFQLFSWLVSVNDLYLMDGDD
jgi:hypothetical protein